MGAIIQDRIARTLEKFEREAETLDEMAQRMTGAVSADGELGECEGLPAICKAWDVPYGRVMAWLMADEKRYAIYNRALAMQAKLLVSETVGIADADPGATEKGGTDTGAVAHQKLRIETRFRVAKYHDAATYGDKQEGGAGGITVVVNRGVGNPSVAGGDAVRVESGGQTLTVL